MNREKLVWPMIALMCASIVAVGIQHGLKSTGHVRAGLDIPYIGQPAAEDRSESQARSPATASSSKEKSIRVEFRKTAIDDALKIMAEIAGRGMGKPPDITGEVIVTFTDIPSNEASGNMRSAYGYNRQVVDNAAVAANQNDLPSGNGLTGILPEYSPTPADAGLVIAVTGIMHSSNRPSAIIENQVVHEGDVIKGVKVAKIEKDAVHFEKDGERWVQTVEEIRADTVEENTLR